MLRHGYALRLNFQLWQHGLHGGFPLLSTPVPHAPPGLRIAAQISIVATWSPWWIPIAQYPVQHASLEYALRLISQLWQHGLHGGFPFAQYRPACFARGMHCGSMDHFPSL